MKLWPRKREDPPLDKVRIHLVCEAEVPEVVADLLTRDDPNGDIYSFTQSVDVHIEKNNYVYRLQAPFKWVRS